MSRNIFKRTEACLEAGGWHFETLYQTWSCWSAGENTHSIL